jgi:adenosine deaminase
MGALVSLHDHLDGGVRAETLCELTDRYGGVLVGLDRLAIETKLSLAARTGGSLASYLEPFEWVTELLRTPEDLHRVAREAVWDLAADGVRHAEIRFAPRLYERWGVSVDEAIEAVADGVLQAASELRVSAGVIVCGMRHERDLTHDAEACVRWWRREVVLGFDIAGDEARWPVADHTAVIGRLVANGVPVTIHAGEAAGWESVRDALHASSWRCRIGHGVRAVENPAFMDELAGRGVHLEVCPSSNVHTGVVRSLEEHPLRVLYERGVQLSVSSDNRSMSATSTSAELRQVREANSWSETELSRLQEMAVDAAWCDDATKAWLRGTLINNTKEIQVLAPGLVRD